MSNKSFPIYEILVQYPPTAPTNYGGLATGVSNSIISSGQQIPQWTPSSEYIKIEYPMTIEFSVQKAVSSSNNSTTISIYNLSESNRSLLTKDRWTQNDTGNGKELRKVIFKAGYNKQLTTVLIGDLVEGYSERKGVDIITKIEAREGLYRTSNAISSISLSKEASKKERTDLIIKDLGIEKGKIGDIFGDDDNRIRGFSYIGNSYQALVDEYGDRVFVEDDKLNILNVNEALEATVPLIDESSGLLGIPRRSGGLINVDLMFEPSIKLGQIVALKSALDTRFDGQYKVMGINHNGIISGSVDGSRITQLQLLIGSQFLGGLQVI